MKRFSTLSEAQDFVSKTVDTPVVTSKEVIRPGVTLEQACIDLGGENFTNSYDLAFGSADEHPQIIAFDNLTSTHEFMQNPHRFTAATSGGFFYLADQASGRPRQLALNLSISQEGVRSLPVSDREAVIADCNSLRAQNLAAIGFLCLNGRLLEWSGSLTDHDTEVKVYSNGNVVITHEDDPLTGSVRVLVEHSRYTPEINDRTVDVGFVGVGRNKFVEGSSSTEGGVDLFAHDFVLRFPRRYKEACSDLSINTVGELALSQFVGGAFSAGPMLDVESFDDHPINRDASLGSRPPALNNRLARTVLYKTQDNRIHVRLFDGRPGSPVFPGLTPAETAQQITSEEEVLWGCFLDSGQTAKLCLYDGEHRINYGNRHYLRWPSEEDPTFIWTPDIGRPVANVIALQLVDSNKLALNREMVEIGALLHDIGVYSLFDSTGELHKHVNYITHGTEGERILKAEGMPESIWRFASHHTGVGLTAQDVRDQNLPLPLADYLAETDEELLVMYADKFHSKTTPPYFNSYAWYREDVAKFGDDKVGKFDNMAMKFGKPDLLSLQRQYSFEIR